MKNSKGISLIALIITIIVIIILAAIVIGGVFNTPNDAKFANFCQQYDELQTQIQLNYYDLYQKYAISNSSSKVPTRYDIYNEVATSTAIATPGTKQSSEWVKIDFTQHTSSKVLTQPALGADAWYLRTSDGKLIYKGFQKSATETYLTPSATGTLISATPAAGFTI